jgi:hypothetical protein
MTFKVGHPKYGGRQKGGSKAQIELKAAILGALEAVDGQAYLERIARKDPRTFWALLGRVLPMTVNSEVQHEISKELQRILEQCDGRSRSIPAASERPGANGTLLALPPPNGQQPH